jgi:flagellar FliL protein
MAKADGKKEAKSGGGLIGVIVVTLVAVGFGAGFGFFLDGQLKDEAKVEPPKDEKAAAPPPAKPTVPASAKLVTMSPIVANLAEPRDVWIRIEASMLIDGLDQGGDALAAQVAEDLVAYLRTATLAQFEGPSGFQNLREDFLDRAMIRDRAHIKDVIIHGVVVE